VAGVNLTMRAETTAVLSKAGMLCADGRCKTLDAAADGYTRGEACVVHLLEAATIEELANGIAAEAVLILGTAVNQDGRSSSLTAPNGPSQQQAWGSSLLLIYAACMPVQMQCCQGAQTANNSTVLHKTAMAAA